MTVSPSIQPYRSSHFHLHDFGDLDGPVIEMRAFLHEFEFGIEAAGGHDRVSGQRIRAAVGDSGRAELLAGTKRCTRLDDRSTEAAHPGLPPRHIGGTFFSRRKFAAATIGDNVIRHDNSLYVHAMTRRSGQRRYASAIRGPTTTNCNTVNPVSSIR